jgi:short-subunit dehydrogenase
MARHRISGASAIVTGASSGIGRAIAVELVARGARVLAVARREDRLRQLQADCRELLGQIEIIAGDISQPAVRELAIAQTVRQFGGLDLLVNAAGISSVERFMDSSVDQLRHTMEVNFFAAAELIRLAVPILEKSSQPMIVNVGSILAHRGIPFHANYCASKFALHGLSESLRPELAKRGIDVLVVSPGTTKTDLYANDTNRGQLPWKQPAGVSPEHVARQAVQAIERGRQEIIPSTSGKIMVWISRFCPSVLDRFFQKYG